MAESVRQQVVGYVGHTMKERVHKLKKRGISESKAIEFSLWKALPELEKALERGEMPIILSPSEPQSVSPKSRKG